MKKSAALKAEDRLNLVSIVNASQRGLGATGHGLPKRGEYIEITFSGQVVAGRIVWSSGERCGILTQDDVNLAALGIAQAGQEQRVCRHCGPGFDRSGRLGSRENASRIVSRLIDFGTITLIASLAAFGLTQLAGSMLIEPMDQVATTLAGQNR